VTTLDLVEAPQALDGARIVVIGQVQELRLQSSSPGNTYTTFALAEGQARALVFARGTVAIDAGDLTEVRGTFHSVAHVGPDTLYDAVEATSVRRLPPAPARPDAP